MYMPLHLCSWIELFLSVNETSINYICVICIERHYRLTTVVLLFNKEDNKEDDGINFHIRRMPW